VVLWSALPFGVILWLTYTVPGSAAPQTGLRVCDLHRADDDLFINNTPYSALNGVMTGDVTERTSLATYRFVAAMGATSSCRDWTLPLVSRFGAGNVAKGCPRPSPSLVARGDLLCDCVLSSRERIPS